MKIGLEIHMQLKTDAKLFCTCSAGYRDLEPNTNICEICTGQPGSKPMSVNRKAVENLLKMALALECRIVDDGIYIQRKHYFYPDLPSGYQRTSKPIGIEGKLGSVRIRELHIEEDPGRYELKKGLVDYNRSGFPLVEVVTEPDLKSPEEAREFLEEISSIADYLEATRDEPGSMRCDANVSLEGGARVEVKNINSFKGVFTALKYEIVRQKRMVESGKIVVQETRHFDEAQGITLSLRKKETEADYRYFPDPDVLPLSIKSEEIEKIRSSIPELPRAKADRFMKHYGITHEEARVIVSEKRMADSFEEMVKEIDSKFLASFIRGMLKKQLNYRSLSFAKSGLKNQRIVELLSILKDKCITEKTAEQTLIRMLDENPDISAEEVAKEHTRISDDEELEKLVEEVIRENPKPVEDYKAGSEKSIHFLSGKVMQKTKGRAEARIVMEILKKKLK